MNVGCIFFKVCFIVYGVIELVVGKSVLIFFIVVEFMKFLGVNRKLFDFFCFCVDVI